MIVHLDADAFFASVEQAADPKLRGKPVAVGGAKRGIVASASYEARKLGIYTPMPTARARKICPRLIVVSGDFERYEQFSRFMFSYVYDFTPVVEVGSIDEGYFDLRGNRRRSPKEIADLIRTAIRQSLKISVSEGIAANKLTSAVASKLKKPSCFLEVAPGNERQFLSPLENKWLPGVGPAMAKTLNQAGLVRIGQIAEVPPPQLSLFAGNGARQLWEFARGIDERPVIAEAPAAKSWSQQETFDEDMTDETWVLAKLRSIADRLFAKVRGEAKTVRTVEVRIRYNDFEDCRRSESLDEPTDLETDSYPVLNRLLQKVWQRRVSLRLVSVKLSGVYGIIFQDSLALMDAGVDPAQRRRLSPVLDKIKARYGSNSIMRGHDLFLEHYGGNRKTDLVRIKRHLKAVAPEWASLNVKSAYSFMDSLLKPEAVVALAKARGCKAVAITDSNLHGAVEFFIAAKAIGIKPIVAAELVADGKSVVAYVKDSEGYKNLCAALSSENRELHPDCRKGLIVRPAGWLPEVRYNDPTEKPMYEVLQSIRTLSLLGERHAGKRKGRFHFPFSPELLNHPEALRDSLEIADQCSFEFELGVLQFPRYCPKDGSGAYDFLRRLALEGLRWRYRGKPELLPRVSRQIEEELEIISEVGYAEYFLLVWEILQECKKEEIEWITRGSAADSLVCYCLGISNVCPIRFELYFRRFLNRGRMALNKLPDIDIDFAHDRKDDVVSMIFQKYQDHAAIVGGFSTYRGRSAFADIAKVMGVSEYQIRRMTERLPWTDAAHVEQAVGESQECRDLDFSEDPYKTALRLAHRLDGFPKNPKMHPCGVVLSRLPVRQLTPLFTSATGYPTTHFDMDQVEAIGLIKMDILAQGGLAVMRDAKRMLADRGVEIDLASLEPWDDPNVWGMIVAGEARGVHHIESPAMCTLERMVNVNNIDDLIAVVSVIRPGAANNLKKEQFALRAQGLEPVDYVHSSLANALRSTYGVVAYEEHILQICEDFAGLAAGRADILRRALVKCQQEKIIEIGREFVTAAKALGRNSEEIRAVWTLICGFQGYAFCRAHSTAYGVEAYEAAWLKRYYPAEFLAAVLTHGKGFYSKLVYTLECRFLGIGFLPPDVNLSQDHFIPEEHAIRVPLFQIKGLSTRTLQRWRSAKPYGSMSDFYARVNPTAGEMIDLMRVGAFDSFGQSRTEQFWQFRQLAQWPATEGQDLLLPRDQRARLTNVALTEPGKLERLRAEQEILGFPVSDHPLAMFPTVNWSSYCRISSLKDHRGESVVVAGMIIEDRLHRQENGRMMKFLSLCDPTGFIECELFADAYKRFGTETVRSPVIEISGKVTPFATGKGHTLRVKRVGPARTHKDLDLDLHAGDPAPPIHNR
jgi:DNA-directed DNA polymerase III PolC